MTRTVRTTMRPDLEIEVGDTEYAQLKAEGLLIEDPATATSAAPATAKKTTSGTAGSKES